MGKSLPSLEDRCSNNFESRSAIKNEPTELDASPSALFTRLKPALNSVDPVVKIESERHDDLYHQLTTLFANTSNGEGDEGCLVAHELHEPKCMAETFLTDLEPPRNSTVRKEEKKESIILKV